MTMSFAAVIADPPSGRAKAVVFDHHDYARSVILRGRSVPWHDPMAYCVFFNQAQGLLKPDVALLDLGRLYSALVAEDEPLQSAMAARGRTGYALRTLLAEGPVSDSVLEFAAVFAQTVRAPVVIQIPSPARWLGRTHHFSGAEPSVLDADDAENASMYVADWLGRFATLPVAGVLLDDRPPADTTDVIPVELDAYTPITNLTDHYRWTAGLRRSDRTTLRGDDRVGGTLPAEFWLQENQQLPTGDFYIAEIPAAALPEDVLGRLTRLN